MDTRSTPSTLAWVISVVSCCAIVLSILVTVVVGSEVRRNFAFHSLQEDLQRGEWSRSRELFGYLSESGGSLESTISSSLPFLFNRTPEAIKHLKESFDILVLLHDRQIEQASMAFHEHRDGWESVFELIKSDVTKATQARQGQQLLEQLSQALDSYRDNTKKIHSVKDKREEIEKKLSQSLDRYDAMAEDYKALFSLHLVEPESDYDEPPHYTDGVLKNLPVLEGVPDGLPSLPDLANAIEAANGSVRLNTDNPQAEFAERLGVFQDLAASLMGGITEFISKLDSFDTSLEDSDKTLDETHEKIVKTASRLFLLQAAPTRDTAFNSLILLIESSVSSI